MKQKLLTILEHLTALPVFSGVHFAHSLLLCVVLCIPLVVILWGFFAIILSALRFTASSSYQGVVVAVIVW